MSIATAPQPALEEISTQEERLRSLRRSLGGPIEPRGFLVTGTVVFRREGGHLLRIAQGVEYQAIGGGRMKWRIHTDERLPMPWQDGTTGEFVRFVIRDAVAHLEYLRAVRGRRN